ncbi:MAG TPA: rhodanese-like domain-containing protein [candidate division Zixibacteria bacterium]|nr:rhodanese-like domain-containing protein [candidate division Zixibacteria bacterium]
MFFKQIFEPKLAVYTYLIGCQRTGEAIVVDPMRDIQRYLDLAKANGLRITAVTDTHIHADYLSGARQLANDHGVKVYASDEGDEDWKFEWLLDSNYAYQLIRDGDRFTVGNIEFLVTHTPGHTPEHVSFAVTDRGGGAREPMGVLTGDFVFVGDVGRPDLLETAAGQVGAMEPSARTLGAELQKFKNLPAHWQVWPAHGAGSACGKSLGAVPVSTIGYELANNPALAKCDNIDGFVEYILTGQPEPPLYFARMKRDNRRGPALLSALPEPSEISAEEISALIIDKSHAILDTRSWEAYSAGHLPGSLFAPLNSQFNTVAGCYVTEDQRLYLICEKSRVDEAVVDLIRIGLDNIVGWISPEALESYRAGGGELRAAPEVDTASLRVRLDADEVIVIDVRRAAEIEETGGIPGALNIAHTRLLERLAEIPTDKEIVLSCHTGARSAFAAGLLASRGFRVSRHGAGFVGWRESGAPVSRNAGNAVEKS